MTALGTLDESTDGVISDWFPVTEYFMQTSTTLPKLLGSLWQAENSLFLSTGWSSALDKHVSVFQGSQVFFYFLKKPNYLKTKCKKLREQC